MEKKKCRGNDKNGKEKCGKNDQNGIEKM